MRNRPKRKRTTITNEYRRLLVVCEGVLTEKQYVQGLHSHLRRGGITTTVRVVGVGKDPLHVVEKCIEVRNKEEAKSDIFDICVCLVDVDQHSTLDEACNVASKNNIQLLISNLKFEVWLRWHKEDKRSALTSIELDHLMDKLDLCTDKRLNSNFPFHHVEQACSIAYQADKDLSACRKGPDPSSAMPILVNLLKNG